MLYILLKGSNILVALKVELPKTNTANWMTCPGEVLKYLKDHHMQEEYMF